MEIHSIKILESIRRGKSVYKSKIKTLNYEKATTKKRMV